AARRARPGGRVVQTGEAPGVADRGAVCGPARVAGAPRAPVRRGPPRLSHPVGDAGDDAEAYPLEAPAEPDGGRWRGELGPRRLKTTMKMGVLKCQTVEGALKELTVYALVYDLVRAVMLEASRRQGREGERVRFVGALRWLARAAADEGLPRLVIHPDR